MPEGPEVKVRAEKLNQLLAGVRLVTIEALGVYLTKAKYQHLRARISGLQNVLRSKKVTIDWVKSKGKLIYMQLGLDHDQKHQVKYLASHLGMTGDWKYAPDKHACIRIDYQIAGGDISMSHLYFDDSRELGTFAIMSVADTKEMLARLGPDVLDKNFTEKKWLQVIDKKRNSKRALAVLLADQHFISGIGNYLRCDILYEAGFDPQKQACDMDEADWEILYEAIHKVIQKSYEAGGTVLQMYKSYDRSTDICPPGTYQPKVYGREYDIEGRVVKTIVIQKRTLYWVPEVQKN
jgi:DNA-formamidopyrimidine glycosylase